ncbi:hypothetical protein N7523_002595 [Penicillium sp. IBT 18751x]|nr:hypothetical protein N7523_002595 [Penicillium sp. IBT 18751x]
MAVTEIALLRLKTPELSSSSKNILKQVQQAQSEWSGYPVQFARQLEDSNYFYIFGGWESVAHHCGDWIKSETNQKFLTQLKDDIDVEWMFHLSMEPSTCAVLLNAPAIAVNRYFVDHEKKADFDAAFKNVGPYLGAHTAPFTYSGGWRIDKEGGDEEFVVLSGWKTIEDHDGFAGAEGLKEFSGTKDTLSAAEVKHAQLEGWE